MTHMNAPCDKDSDPTAQPLRLLTTYCGRAWVVRFDADKLREIRDTLGLDLSAHVDDPGELSRTLGDEIEGKVPAILTILCAEQLCERDLSPKGFAQLLTNFGSKYMTESVFVVLRALGDYFPDSWLGRLIEPALDQWRQSKQVAS